MSEIEQTRDLLHSLTEQVLQDLRKTGPNVLFEPLDGYHEFKKSRLKSGFLEKYLDPLNLTSKDVQIEFALVPIDLSHQVHVHEDAFALATPLGQNEGVESPRGAYYYLQSKGEKWIPIDKEMWIEVPPKEKHGFALDEGGQCYFLTIQSPPTDQEDLDDYINAQGPPFHPRRITNKLT